MLLALAKPLRVLLVENDPHLQHAIRDAILSEPAFELGAVCAGRGEALNLIGKMPLDVVLVSLALEDGPGLDVVKAARGSHPRSEVLVMGTSDDKENMFSALQAGATACLLKENLYHAHQVRRNSIVGSIVSGWMLGSTRDTSAATDARLAELSTVQRDILRCLAAGLSNKEIARRLLLSSYNVDYHLKCLRKRFLVRNRVQLVSAAMTLFRS